MSVWKLYRYEDLVIAPTMVVTDDGAFVETQPVQAVSIDSQDSVIALLKDLLSSSPAPAQDEDINKSSLDDFGRPILLEILDIKRWQDFERKALMYTLHCSDSALTMYVTGRGSDGMWSIADSQQRTFDLAGSYLENTCREIAREIINRPPVQARMLGLPGPRNDG